MKYNPIKTVVIIAGPTAVGKTSLAIALATHLKTEIISADSRQCYRELNIGVARPTEVELSRVPHHFIASHSIHETVTAITFEKFALHKLDELFSLHDVVIMTGGTGLYIKAFCEGLDEIPVIAPGIRETVTGLFKEKGIAWLQEEVREKDPGFYEIGEIENPNRLLRALEVVESTGRSILSFRKGEKIKRGFNIIKIGIELPREELKNNIAIRLDKMMETGLLDEVKSLLAFKKLNALQTVGYTELFEHLEGKLSLPEALEKIRINTRQYAKRQMTWFRKDEEIKWFNSGEAQKIKYHLEIKLRAS